MRASPSQAAAEGHHALSKGLGQVGDVATAHLPWLLRLAHVKSKITGGDSGVSLQESAQGLLLWKVSMGRCNRHSVFVTSRICMWRSWHAWDSIEALQGAGGCRCGHDASQHMQRTAQLHM
jgi:hypothetical protein